MKRSERDKLAVGIIEDYERQVRADERRKVTFNITARLRDFADKLMDTEVAGRIQAFCDGLDTNT